MIEMVLGLLPSAVSMRISLYRALIHFPELAEFPILTMAGFIPNSEIIENYRKTENFYGYFMSKRTPVNAFKRMFSA